MRSLFLFFLFPIFVFGQTNISSELEKYMQAQEKINHFGGTVLVMKNDTVLLKKAYGLAEYEWQVPNTIDTKFVLASVTKYFTAIAIMQLVQEGHLSLEDKLSKFFPDYPKGDSVTIHMMLTHTSGLPLDFDELYMNYTSISKDSAITIIKRKPYLFTPGTGLTYSNIGYFLLSQIIEKASGKTYAEFLQKQLFDKAGMTHTGVCNNDSVIPKMARIYYRTDKGLAINPYINWNLNTGHDGIYSTVEDLYKLDRALYGEVLITESTKLKMTTQYNKIYPDNGFFDSYGYGILINPYYNHNHYLLTHSGGFIGVITSFDRFTKDNVFIAVLSNNESESHIVSSGLSGIVFHIPVELPYKHQEIKADPSLYSRYAGKFGDVEILNQHTKLYLNNSAIELLPESKTKFFRADNPDRTVEFVTNKKGVAHSLILTKGGVKTILTKKATKPR